MKKLLSLWSALLRPIGRWRTIIRDILPWDFFLAWILYLRKAIATYDYTIWCFLVPALAYGYSGNGLLREVPQSITAHSAPRTIPVHLALPVHSQEFNSTIEKHRIPPPSFKWLEELEDHWFYYCNGKRTGVWIDKHTSIPILWHKKFITVLELKEPFYHIFHSVDDKDYNVGTIDIMDLPSLQEAQHVAELYYLLRFRH